MSLLLLALISHEFAVLFLPTVKPKMDGKKPSYPTQEDKSRVMSSQDKYHPGETKGFAQRFQRAADRRDPPRSK